MIVLDIKSDWNDVILDIGHCLELSGGAICQ